MKNGEHAESVCKLQQKQFAFTVPKLEINEEKKKKNNTKHS